MNNAEPMSDRRREKQQLIRINSGKKIYLLNLEKISQYQFFTEHVRKQYGTGITPAIFIHFAGVPEIQGSELVLEGDTATRLWNYLQEHNVPGGQLERLIQIETEDSTFLINPEQIVKCQYGSHYERRETIEGLILTYLGEDEYHSYSLVLEGEPAAKLWGCLNGGVVEV